MKVAPKVVLLFKDPSGLGTAIFEALQPNPNSNLQRRKESLDLSLQRYGIKDQKVSLEVVHFLHGTNLEVSLLLMENYEPPVLACALNEVLALLVGDGLSNTPTIVAPFVVAATKLKMENRTSVAVDNISVYGLQVGASSGLTKTLCTNLRSPPHSLQIFNEQLTCLLQLVRVLKMPTFVIIGKKGQNLHRKSSEEEHEAVSQYSCKIKSEWQKRTSSWLLEFKQIKIDEAIYCLWLNIIKILAELNGLSMPGSKLIQLQNSNQSGKKTSSWLLEFKQIKIDKSHTSTLSLVE